MIPNEKAAPIASSEAARGPSSRSSKPNFALIQGGRQGTEVPHGWEWLHRLREGGLVPDRRFVRVTLECAFDAADALPVPDGDLRGYNLAPIAGLDVFLIFDAHRARVGRLQSTCAALLSSGAESLRLIDLQSRYFVATLKVGHEETGRWTPL